MKTFNDALRADIEEQFEFADLPPPMTASRSKDFKKACNECQTARCACIGWTAFENDKQGRR